MTNKKSLLNKLWNGAKNTAKVGAIATLGYLALNPSNAYSQNYTLNEESGSAAGQSTQKDMFNEREVPTYVLLDQSTKSDSRIEKLAFLPALNTIRVGNKLYPRLVYTPKKAQINGQDLDVFKYRAKEEDKKKFDDLFAAKGKGGAVLTLNGSEAEAAGFHVIRRADGSKFVYFPIDTANNNLEGVEKEKVKAGKNLGVIFPANGMKIMQDFNPTTKQVEYLIGNPNNLYFVELNPDKVKDPTLSKEGKDLLDSLGVKYISSEKAKEIWENGSLIPGAAYEFHNFTFFDNQAPEKEKKNSNVQGRVKIGGFYTVPSGLEGSVGVQLKVSDKAYVGIKGFYSTLTKNTDELSHEGGFKKLINAPLDMYIINTGADIDKNYVDELGYGAGATFSYVNGKWEINAEAGLVKQNVEKTMTSEGEEYMTIAGVKDSSSVTPYNETNVTNSSAMPAYVQIGGEWYPFNGGALKNLSVAGDVGYLFGERSTTYGGVGLKYTFDFGNKEDTKENKTQ